MTINFSIRKRIIFSFVLLLLLILVITGFYLFKQKNSDSNTYIAQDDTQVFSRIEKREPGVYFFYFPECPWCEEILPILKKEATIKKTPIWTTNIHNEAFTKKNKLSLQHIISQSQNGNEIIVPFIVIINKKKDLTAQIGLVDPNIKLDREKLIKKETVSLLNKSNR